MYVYVCSIHKKNGIAFTLWGWYTPDENVCIIRVRDCSDHLEFFMLYSMTLQRAKPFYPYFLFFDSLLKGLGNTVAVCCTPQL